MANCVVVGVVEPLNVLVDDGVSGEKAATVDADEERKKKRNVEIFIVIGKSLG